MLKLGYIYPNNVKGLLFAIGLSLICSLPTLAQRAMEGPIADKVRSIKVMSYNMRIASPPSTDWQGTDLGAIADVINRNGPDIVALQEVDAYTKRSGPDLHQAKELGKLTDMEYYFAKAVDRSEGDYGVAILSRLPIKGSHGYRLPVSEGSDGEIRGLALIIVEVNNTDVVFMSAHFDHLSDKDRLVQAEKMIEIIDQFKDYPISIWGPTIK